MAYFYIPATVSDSAKKVLDAANGAWPDSDDLEGWKKLWETEEEKALPQNEEILNHWEATAEEKILGGVPVVDIKPKDWIDNGKVLVYTHGGAYVLYSAKTTYTNSVPVASITGLRVVSINYTVAPFSKWNQTTDQVVAVIKELQKDYALTDIAMYGDSAGGGLTPGSILKMIDQGLGMPAAVVLMSPWTDITETGDTYQTLKQADLVLGYPYTLANAAGAYADPIDQRNPYVSPVYGNYSNSKDFPPTLIQVGTKEIFLSNAIRYYQKLDRAGIPVKLDPYEGMWHVFQSFGVEESFIAIEKMSVFLAEHLKYEAKPLPPTMRPPQKVFKRRSPCLLVGILPEEEE